MAKAWTGLRTSEHWPIMESWITARIASRQNATFLTEDCPTNNEFIEMRAEVKTLYRLLRAGRESEERIEELRQRERDLRAVIERGEMTGQSRDLSAEK